MFYKLKNGINEVDLISGFIIVLKYVLVFYYILISFMIIGFGNIVFNIIVEKLFGCIIMLLGGEKMFVLFVWMN